MLSVAPAESTTSAFPASPTAIRGKQAQRRLLLARAAWVIVVGFVATLFIEGTPIFHRQISTFCAGPQCEPWQRESSRVSISFYANWSVAREVLFVTVFCVIAGIMVWKAGNERIVVYGALSMVLFAGVTYPDTITALGQSGPVWRWIIAGAACLGSTSFLNFLMLFPDGRFVPAWTRIVSAAWVAVSIAAYAAPRDAFIQAQGTAYFLAVFIFVTCAILSQIFRYRRSATPLQRQQTKWVMYGVATAFAGLFVSAMLLPLIGPDIIPNRAKFALIGMTIASAFLLLVPLSIGVAMIRFRLWDVDRIVNRTLLYGALSAAVVLIYAAVVVGIGALLPSRVGTLLALLGTCLVAVLFQPLRGRLQRVINRLLYGERDEPYAVLSRLGAQLEATLARDSVLQRIVETVAQSLRLPYAAIAMHDAGSSKIMASIGAHAGESLGWPLVYGQETIGELIVSPRAAGESFSTADHRLLDDISRQAGVAVHAAQLTADLETARIRLISAREEERRRLRRDLHDGLGPQLASQSLTLDAARKLMPTDPATADALLDELRKHMQSSVEDVRRLVYGLRPPSLDDLGLVAALREGVRNLGHAGLNIEIRADESLPSLSAAVEVAAFRIVQEAVTNVVRHAEANACLVTLRMHDNNMLAIEISDDGRGMPAVHQHGVGLHSMRERAVELGGSWSIHPGPNRGTRVLALLPIGEVE